MVCRCFSFSKVVFPGSMFVFRGVTNGKIGGLRRSLGFESGTPSESESNPFQKGILEIRKKTPQTTIS